MKKAVVSIVAIIYFAISSGMIVNLHFCMNRFASADIGFASSKNECDICGMHKTKSTGCCHDEVKLVKLQNDQNKSVDVAFHFSASQALPVILSPFFSSPFYSSDEIKHQPDLSPPLFPPEDLHIQNCVFRV